MSFDLPSSFFLQRKTCPLIWTLAPCSRIVFVELKMVRRRTRVPEMNYNQNSERADVASEEVSFASVIFLMEKWSWTFPIKPFPFFFFFYLPWPPGGFCLHSLHLFKVVGSLKEGHKGVLTDRETCVLWYDRKLKMGKARVRLC